MVSGFIIIALGIALVFAAVSPDKFTKLVDKVKDVTKKGAQNG